MRKASLTSRPELGFRPKSLPALLKIVTFQEFPLRSSGTKYRIGLTFYFWQSREEGTVIPSSIYTIMRRSYFKALNPESPVAKKQNVLCTFHNKAPRIESCWRMYIPTTRQCLTSGILETN